MRIIPIAFPFFLQGIKTYLFCGGGGVTLCEHSKTIHVSVSIGNQNNCRKFTE